MFYIQKMRKIQTKMHKSWEVCIVRIILEKSA